MGEEPPPRTPPAPLLPPGLADAVALAAPAYGLAADDWIRAWVGVGLAYTEAAKATGVPLPLPLPAVTTTAPPRP